MGSINVMLAQLPPHTVAHKVPGYEHLDLLWGKDVDKLVIPHVLNLLKTFAFPVDAQDISDKTSSPHPNQNTNGLQKCVLTKDALESPASQGTGDHSIAAPEQYSHDVGTIEHIDDASDSDQTMGCDEHESSIRPSVSFAQAIIGASSTQENAT